MLLCFSKHLGDSQKNYWGLSIPRTEMKYFSRIVILLVLVIFSTNRLAKRQKGKRKGFFSRKNQSNSHAAYDAKHVTRTERGKAWQQKPDFQLQELTGKKAQHGTHNQKDVDKILAIKNNSEFAEKVFQMMKADDSDVLKDIDEDEEPLGFAPSKIILRESSKLRSGNGIYQEESSQLNQKPDTIEKRQWIHPGYNTSFANMSMDYQSFPSMAQTQNQQAAATTTTASSMLPSADMNSVPQTSFQKEKNAVEEMSTGKEVTIKSSRVCKPGPPLAATKRLPNCLLIGDSITLGSSYAVAAALQGRCVVQVSPFSKGGCALDSRYGLECIQLILSTTNLTPTRYDVVIFNFGMHDINYSDKFPEEFNDETEYTRNLGRIKKILMKTGARVAFTLTTPVPYDVKKNDLVVKYNKIAKKVMSKAPAIDTIDLYSFVVDKCGKIPFKNCFMMKKPHDVHYGLAGSILLGKQIAAKIASLLKKRNLWVQRGFSLPENVNLTEPFFPGLKDGSIKCSTNDTVPTRCPSETTCVPNAISRSNFACCMLENGVDCKDNFHCCPENTKCHKNCSPKWCECVLK